MKISIRMNPGYGLGDNISFTIVLQHLRKQRPHWEISYITNRGRETCARELATVFNYESNTKKKEDGETEINVQLYDNYHAWDDKPNTVAVGSLIYTFALDYDPALGRPVCPISDEKRNLARSWLAATRAKKAEKFAAVILHYEGWSAQNNKNLTHEQAAAICQLIRQSGRVPIILDWWKKSPLPDGKNIFNPGMLDTSHDAAAFWGGDAEINVALIDEVEGFIGIDSGPSKCAACTDTPSLIIWRNHHPIRGQDPAPNCLHLIPENHEQLRPISGNRKVLQYFENNYRHEIYEDIVDSISSLWQC